MLPIMFLAHKPVAPEAPEKREELLQMMIASRTVIYRHFEP